jgi:hypothetical protein
MVQLVVYAPKEQTMLASIRTDSKKAYTLHLVLETPAEVARFERMPRFTVTLADDRVIQLQACEAGKRAQVRARGGKHAIQKNFSQEEENAIAFNMTPVKWHEATGFRGVVIDLPLSVNQTRTVHRSPRTIGSIVNLLNHMINNSKEQLELVIENGLLVVYRISRERVE